MTRYPLAYMSWKPRKNSMHGVREIEPLINTQIAVNKQFTALGTQVLNNAMPKLVYNKRQFPDGWDPDAQTIGVVGDPTEALTGVAGSMPIPTDAFGITNNLLDTAKNVAGANDAALGNIKNPDNKGAIIAAQTATAAPLSLTRLSYYQFVEDYTRILIDMFHAYYGIRHVKTTETVTNPETGETSEQTGIKEYDFAQLPVDAMDLNINIGAASYGDTLGNVFELCVPTRSEHFPARPPERRRSISKGVHSYRMALRCIDVLQRLPKRQQHRRGDVQRHYPDARGRGPAGTGNRSGRQAVYWLYSGTGRDGAAAKCQCRAEQAEC